MPQDQNVLARSAALIQQYATGLMTTIDPEGMPCSRYMTAALLNGKVQQVYCLTVRNGRKLEHLRQNPAVCWVFADPDLTEVVTLHGHAKVVDDATGADEQLWDRLIRHVEPYNLGMLGQQEGDGYQFVATHVHRLEYLNPEAEIVKPRLVELDGLATR